MSRNLIFNCWKLASWFHSLIFNFFTIHLFNFFFILKADYTTFLHEITAFTFFLFYADYSLLNDSCLCLRCYSTLKLKTIRIEQIRLLNPHNAFIYYTSLNWKMQDQSRSKYLFLFIINFRWSMMSI